MKRILFAILVALMLGACYGPYTMIDGAYQVSIKNETAYSLDVQVGNCTFDAVLPGETSALATDTFIYQSYQYTTVQISLAESGLPLLNRGSLNVCDGKSYVISVYYDFYSQEYRYALE